MTPIVVLAAIGGLAALVFLTIGLALLFRDRRARRTDLAADARDYIVPNPFLRPVEAEGHEPTSVDVVPPRPAINHVALRSSRELRN